MERGLHSTSAKKTNKKFNLRSYFLLCSFYFLLFTFPAQAARLQSWRLSPTQNQLEFFTDDGVQPRAQLLSDPTRLVIDLPGVTFGRPQVIENYSGAVRAVRVGQFDRETTRIVVEYAPGYTVDPSRIQFQGRAANQWAVQLPSPSFSGVGTPPVTQPPVTQPPLTRPPITQLPPSTGRTFVQSLQATGDGFFLRTTGGTPEVRSLRSGDRRQMIIDIFNSTLSPNLFPRDLPVNVNGVSRAQITQFDPNTVRLTLTLSPDGGNWQASASPSGGLIVLPQTVGGTPGTPQPPTGQTAIVQSVELDANRQLVIRGNQPLNYTTGWDRATSSYRVLIRSARTDANFRGPQLPAGSPLIQARVRQDGNDVAILLTPASGVQFGEIVQTAPQQLTLPLRRGLFPVVPPTTPTPIPNPIPNPTPTPVPVPPRPTPTPVPRPPIPNGRLVVVIDAGHGGPDPGAVGIGGIQEKEIVLDISRRVQATLERSGVTVVMTRNADIDLDLQPRVDIAQRANATVFVSIHANSISLSRPDVNGLETYYFQTGLELARTIHRNVLQGTGIEDRGVRSARFYVLRRTTMPSVLVEVGFVTGRNDAARLRDSSYRQRMADSIARGVLEYLGRR
ncbi:N-acetylmuramoyl-L-alanine amidase [Leptolyngbya sp. NIES-2104]|uniref:N-acetylmuramoyl-L-alanine amidase n=1 Tax=Leptolyngbya sp. NIES-2104 TaxID=1552121 RepID=UPI0006EC8DFA|nr:N-acetylmuramoyl-L-alanine amidase [Leptolyngbya sp. NIES-2104]GAP98570.1 N-acetylmuramoyl-L-alanine amidase [Leptolyngbya sp. NIES-2104]